jgi:hypothetical protein
MWLPNLIVSIVMMQAAMIKSGSIDKSQTPSAEYE